MANISITFDTKTGFYDATILSKGIATQAKTLDELIKNINESLTLQQEKNYTLQKFNLSFEDSYVNS